MFLRPFTSCMRLIQCINKEIEKNIEDMFIYRGDHLYTSPKKGQEMVDLFPKDSWTRRYLLISWISEVNAKNGESNNWCHHDGVTMMVWNDCVTI